MNKDIKQLVRSFVVISLVSGVLYAYFTKDNFSWEPILVITLIWLGIFLFIFLITSFTRKLNKFGFYAKRRGEVQGFYRFFRAIKRWIMNQPSDYGRDEINR